MSGLFGNPAAKPNPLGLGAAQPATSSGLFGSAATGASTGTGLFGNPTQPAGGATSSLFGNAASAATTSAAPSGGLFGASTQAAPAAATGGGLFGPLPSKASDGLFAQGIPPAEPNKTLFGSQPTGNLQQVNAQQIGGSQIGSGQTGSGQTAYFNSLLEKNKKRMREDEKNGLGGMPKIELGLGDISRRVRELGGISAGARGDPKADSKAHYLLAASGVNPGTALKDLNKFNPAGGVSTQAIPEWDPDSHKYVEELQQQTTLKMIAEGIERAHKNFDAYLENHVDINWEEQRRRVYEHFGLTPRGTDATLDALGAGTAASFVPGATGTFGRSARRGRTPGQSTPNRSVFGLSGLQKSVIGTPTRGPGNANLFGESGDKVAAAPSVNDDRFRIDKETKFAERVQKLNESRLIDKDNYKVLKEFESVESDPSGALPPEVRHAYKALIEIVGEGKSKQVKQREFKDEYLEDSPSSTKSSAIRKRILDGSRRALETKFFEEAVDLITKNPKEAALGGVPSILNQIRALIRVKDSRKDLKPDGIELQQIEDDYCWATIFYLLRSGHVREAAKYVADHKQAFQSLDRNFVTYISSYVNSSDQRLPRAQQDKMNSEYSQRMRIAPENSLDPYRMACYKIIGRCELSKRNIEGFSQTVEDWTWLQFALARESNKVEEIAAEVFGLDDVRQVIRDIGQRHFGKGSEANAGGYGIYFYLQILAGLFESAIDFLYSHAYISAVHVAIALDYYGLLRVSDFNASESELLTYTTRDQPQINFGRMLGYYTRDFRAANSIAACDYLTLIYLDADVPGELGKSQAQLCHEALRELILETREFAQLLGDIQFDGSRIRGAIEQRLPLIGITERDDFLRTVTLQAASVADDSGRTTDAVLLYHLSDDFDAVITIINRALSDACSVDMGTEPLRVDPVKPREITQPGVDNSSPGSSFSLTAVDDPAILARNFVGLYNREALFFQKIRPQNRDVCGLLIRISEARSLIESASWAEALDIIAGLGLLPLNADGKIPIIRAAAQNVAALPPTVSRLVGPLLLWTITAIGRQREILNGQGSSKNEVMYESGTRKVMSEELVSKAKDLMTFAGLVSFRLPKGVWDGVTMGAGEMGVY